jgi:hypothetical protein
MSVVGAAMVVARVAKVVLLRIRGHRLLMVGPSAMSGEVWNTEADCVNFDSGKCSKYHRRPRCDKGAACKALKQGTCRLYHPKAEVLTVLGDPDSDKAKKYLEESRVDGHCQWFCA